MCVNLEFLMYVFYIMKKKNGYKFCLFFFSVFEYVKCLGVKIMVYYMVIWSFCVERKIFNVFLEKFEGNY